MNSMLIGTKSWLNQSITLHPHSGVNSNGQSTYATSSTVACRLTRKNENTMDASGNEVISTAQILVDGSVAVTPLDKIVLSDGTQPYIISILDVASPKGTSYYKIIYM